MVSSYVTDNKGGNTVFACLEGGLCKVVVGLVWSSDDDEVYLRVLEDMIEGAMYFYGDAETVMNFACRRRGIALED